MEYIDLSRPVAQGMPVYPGDAPVQIELRNTLARDGYTEFLLKTGLHAGTHVDAPMHMLPDSRPIGTFPLSSFAGRGVLLDVRGETTIGYKPEYETKVRPGDIALLFTGADWDFYGGGYFKKHPVVSVPLAEFFVSHKIKMLGMDTPSPDRLPFTVHKLLLQNGIFLLENLTNLSALAGVPSFEVEAVPLRLAAEASPVRAFARVRAQS